MPPEEQMIGLRLFPPELKAAQPQHCQASGCSGRTEQSHESTMMGPAG